MDRTYANFSFGIFVGLLIGHYSKDLSLTHIIIYSIFMFLLSFKNFSNFYTFIAIVSYSIFIPISWICGDFNWYEPIFMLWIIYSIFYTLFIKENNNKPIFHYEGDITLIP